MRCVIVVPARMASTRFPGKPLVDLCGKPMVQWVVEQLARLAGLDQSVEFGGTVGGKRFRHG